MKAGPDQQGVQSRVVLISRAVLAAILALSFLAVLLPLRNASAAGLKACCIGKAGHESGSCSAGLIQSGAPAQISEVSQPKARSSRFAKAKGGIGAGEHCHSATNSHPDVAESANTAEVSESTSASKASGSPNVHAVRSTCPSECGTCSVSYTRRPRPREQSTQSSIVRPNLLLLSYVFISNAQQPRLSNWKWSQLQPRAPPALLV